jgi:hypothetical protein
MTTVNVHIQFVIDTGVSQIVRCTATAEGADDYNVNFDCVCARDHNKVVVIPGSLDPMLTNEHPGKLITCRPDVSDEQWARAVAPAAIRHYLGLPASKAA